MSAVSTKCTDILGSETIHIHTLTHILNIIKLLLGFPGGSVVKNPPANTGDMVLIPGSGRSPGEGNGSPLQYSCPGNTMDGGAWWATVHRVTKSRTQLSNFTQNFHFAIIIDCLLNARSDTRH